MKIEFNEKKLNSLLQDFYNCTKIPISLYDHKFNCLYYSVTIPEYCNNVRSCKNLEHSCDVCDFEHFQIVNQSKQPLTYSCHAGICELISPIMYENIVIAYIMLGRFRDTEKEYSSLKKVRDFAKKYGLDVNAQEKAYRKLQFFPKDVIFSIVNILNSLIQFIWTENIISTHKDLLPQKIENYINQNLSSDLLTVENICEVFFLSKRTLYNIFHQEFQDTFCNYVLKKRLHAAKKILLNSKSTITEISARCGFTDYNYFTRAFTKKYGMPPTKFRKENSSKALIRQPIE